MYLIFCFIKSEGIILGVGHPLLDIICRVESTFLDKYGLKADDSIRANDSHQRLYTEITEQFECQYSAGGSVQNSLMAVQWVLNQPNCVTFMGTIGDDHYGRVMIKKTSEHGINFVPQIEKTLGTGTSACLITDNGKNRSLIAYLGASQTKIVGHLRKNYKFVEKAKYFYTSGYQLCADPESVMEMALHAHNNPGKMFCLNLSAPYVSQKFSEPLLEVFPYVDLLFGNRDDIQAFAQMNGWQV